MKIVSNKTWNEWVDISRQNNNLRDMLTAAEARVMELGFKIRRLEGKYQGNYKRLTETYDKIATLRADNEAKYAEIARLNEPCVCQGCAEYSLEIAEFSSAMMAEEKRAITAEARVKELEERNRLLRSRIIGLNDRIAHLEDDIAGRDTVILRLESELAEAKSRNRQGGS